MNDENSIRYFSLPENAAKAIAYGNPPRKNSYWLMTEVEKYIRGYMHVGARDIPILLEANLKKNGKTRIEKFFFPTIDSAAEFIKDTGLTRHRLSIVSKKFNMPTILEVFVHYSEKVATYIYRLEDEKLLKEKFDIGDLQIPEALFCVYSVVNGKPYKFAPFESEQGFV